MLEARSARFAAGLAGATIHGKENCRPVAMLARK
jgi:hypothetical protein